MGPTHFHMAGDFALRPIPLLDDAGQPVDTRLERLQPVLRAALRV